MSVKLTKAQNETLASLPAELRAPMQAFYEAEQTRKHSLGFEINENGNVVIRGLGGDFPLGMQLAVAKRVFSTEVVALAQEFLAKH